MRIKLRVDAMRAAGAWVKERLEERPYLRESMDQEEVEFFKFLESLSRRTGNSIEIDRDFAARFVYRFESAFREKSPELLFQDSDERIWNGKHALAWIVLDIKAALPRGRGNPRTSADPIEAFETNERHKKGRVRSTYGKVGDYSYELTAKELGVGNSKKISAEELGAGTSKKISDTIKKGAGAIKRVEEVRSVLPPGHEVLFVLTDSSSGADQGVMAVKMPPKKVVD